MLIVSLETIYLRKSSQWNQDYANQLFLKVTDMQLENNFANAMYEIS